MYKVSMYTWPSSGSLEVKKPYLVGSMCSEVSELSLTWLTCMSHSHAFLLTRFQWA